jgi:2-amino-4-hydroxy-6-hydroxymethyldihydropteridine diphosphokinase
MTYSYYLSLGSNINPKILYLKKAIDQLNQIGKIIKKSNIYLTQPWGDKDQPEFYNAMIEYQSELSPEKLLAKIKKIEYDIGRRKTYKWGPRKIDIDLIFCQGIVLSKNNFNLPHIEFNNRLFILKLMAELNKDYIVDGTKKSIKYFLKNCPDKSKIKKMDLVW